MARKTHWKALTRSQKKLRRYNRRYGLLISIFGKPMDCCTFENPCCPTYPDDWIRNYREFPYFRGKSSVEDKS